MIDSLSHSRRRVPKGFTLIELLTVIAIIAVLASLTVGMASAAKAARINSRAQGDLRKLQTAIEAYKADRNAYPPDGLLRAGVRKANPVISPLYYELRGTEVVNGAFRVAGAAEALRPDALEQVFGRRGFLNASIDAAEPARGYLDVKASEVKRVRVKGVEVELLVTPFDWPSGTTDPAPPLSDSRANPWRYVSTSPTNNPGSFDLWAEIYDPKAAKGPKVRLFKNW
jgi:prepilin-type N-terminal cleavage/methylation domain-containing protein